MTLLLAGYFPKRIVARPEWLAVPHVTSLWSVSECFSKGPPGWIDHWRHNDLGLFDSPALARSVLPADDTRFSLAIYRLLPVLFRDGGELPLEIPAFDSAPLPADARTLGFDAVELSGGYLGGCSPLSCNSAATSFPVNEHCLFDTLDAARAGAREFSTGSWEPGPYVVVEVMTALWP